MVSIQIVGGLTRDAELKYTNSGDPILNFSVGTSDRVKKDGQYVEESSYWDCTMFGKRGEALVQYMTKGKQLAVSGTARVETWEKDGQKHSKVKVNVNDVQLLGGKSEAKPAVSSSPNTPPKPSSDGFEDDPPF